MANKREIIKVPDPLLRKTSSPVDQVDSEIIQLMDDMLETMYAAPGIGLAAIQVAVPKRVIVIDTSEEDEPPAPICFVNPEIVRLSDEMRTHEEGCLSIPDTRIEIERPSTVTVRYVDRDGKQVEIYAEGLLATALQHEIDHLDGRLIIDHISRLQRDIIVRRLKKQARATA